MPQRSFRTPPAPGITAPASGSCRSACCNALYSSSDRYSCTRRVNSLVSTKADHKKHYTSMTYNCNPLMHKVLAGCGYPPPADTAMGKEGMAALAVSGKSDGIQGCRTTSMREVGTPSELHRRLADKAAGPAADPGPRQDPPAVQRCSRRTRVRRAPIATGWVRACAGKRAMRTDHRWLNVIN